MVLFLPHPCVNAPAPSSFTFTMCFVVITDNYLSSSTLVAEELPPDTEGKPALVCGTADVSELIRSFEAATGLTESGALQNDFNSTITFHGLSDFVSLATGVLLEPFLETLGHGTYCVRPSPFAGCVLFSDVAMLSL